VFLEIIASANDLVDCGEKPDGSSGASRLLTLKHVKQGFNKRGKHLSDRKPTEQASPNAACRNGVEDGKGVLASLVVHPVRIVVPVRTRKVSGQENAMLFGTIVVLTDLGTLDNKQNHGQGLGQSPTLAHQE